MSKEKVAISAIKKGDHRGMNTIVSLHQDMVYSIVFSMLRAQPLALEATQDVFMKAYHAIATYDESLSFGGWLYRIAYRTGIDYIRKQKSEQNMLDGYQSTMQVQDHTETNTGYSTLVAKEKSNQLNAHIDLLDLEEQSLIRAYYFQEMTIQEIAQIHDLSDSNTKVKLYRARKKLHHSMTQKAMI